MPMPRKLTNDQVVEIRYAYEHQRDISDNDPEYPEVPVYVTENNLADRYGVSRSLIRKIVLGLVYADLEGPLDERRRASAKEVVNATPPTAVEVVVTAPGRDPKTYTYPAGTRVSVVGVCKDTDAYSENGRPRRGTATSKAKATPKAADADEDETLHAELTRLERISQSKRKPHHDRRIAALRGSLGRGEPDSVGNASGNI